MTVDHPYPGSVAARTRGCRCDPHANREGEGIATVGGTVRYAISGACPLHAGALEPTPKDPDTMDLFGEGGG